jgi:hypothetical protein
VIGIVVTAQLTEPLVIDTAGWHLSSRLDVPPNITLILRCNTEAMNLIFHSYVE